MFPHAEAGAKMTPRGCGHGSVFRVDVQGWMGGEFSVTQEDTTFLTQEPQSWEELSYLKIFWEFISLLPTPM